MIYRTFNEHVRLSCWEMCITFIEIIKHIRKWPTKSWPNNMNVELQNSQKLITVFCHLVAVPQMIANIVTFHYSRMEQPFYWPALKEIINYLEKHDFRCCVVFTWFCKTNQIIGGKKQNQPTNKQTKNTYCMYFLLRFFESCHMSRVWRTLLSLVRFCMILEKMQSNAVQIKVGPMFTNLSRLLIMSVTCRGGF